MIRPPPISTLFPYTTLFRSDQLARLGEGDVGVGLGVEVGDLDPVPVDGAPEVLQAEIEAVLLVFPVGCEGARQRDQVADLDRCAVARAAATATPAARRQQDAGGRDEDPGRPEPTLWHSYLLHPLHRARPVPGPGSTSSDECHSNRLRCPDRN